MNKREYVVKKLKSFSREDIRISHHARIRMTQRQIKEKDIVENIINPERLKYAKEEKTKNKTEEKFDCYFDYSKTLCHRYVLVIKKNILVITVIKINKRWQHIAEKVQK